MNKFITRMYWRVRFIFIAPPSYEEVKAKLDSLAGDQILGMNNDARDPIGDCRVTCGEVIKYCHHGYRESVCKRIGHGNTMYVGFPMPPGTCT